MTMKKFSYLIVAILLFSSCKSGETDKLQANSEVMDEKASELSKDTLSNPDEVIGSEKGDWIRIKYANLTVSMEDVELGWEEMFLSDNDSLYTTKSDTAYLNLFPGDWFYDKKFKIEQKEYDDIKLYEKIEYHVSVSSNRAIEVPFCVMSDWRNFESDWSQIKLTKDQFRFASNEDKTDPIIDFTKDELLLAVKAHCGKEWYEELKSLGAKKRQLSDVFASSYTFKIVARNSKTNKTVVKYIVFFAPTSC
jgi:hypothetical protein